MRRTCHLCLDASKYASSVLGSSQVAGGRVPRWGASDRIGGRKAYRSKPRREGGIPMLSSAWIFKHRQPMASVLLAVSLQACDDGVGPGRGIESKITGYMVSGQANGTDPRTGERLACAFLTGVLATGGPLNGSWTGTTRITVFRNREGESQRVSYDTTDRRAGGHPESARERPVPVGGNGAVCRHHGCR